jgi:hypothetical protein
VPSIKHERCYSATLEEEDARQLVVIAIIKIYGNNLRDSIPFPYTLKDAEQWIAHCGKQKPVLNFAVTVPVSAGRQHWLRSKKDVYRKSMEIGYFVGEAYWNLGSAQPPFIY